MEMAVTNRIVWFEIPVQVLDRACQFYETLFGETMRRESMGTTVQLAVFPYEGTGVSGCLWESPNGRPNGDGVRIYLAAGRHGLDSLLARVEAAGGTITTPPVQLPDGMGRFAHFRDSEGNIIGLHED